MVLFYYWQKSRTKSNFAQLLFSTCLKQHGLLTVHWLFFLHLPLKQNPRVSLLVCLLVLMWCGHVLAASILPLNPNSPSRILQDSSFSWDYDDAGIEISDGEYVNSVSGNFLIFP